jgi:hypothetical protein
MCRGPLAGRRQPASASRCASPPRYADANPRHRAHTPTPFHTTRVARRGRCLADLTLGTLHTLFFSEDAVSLETSLHREFADRALNRANTRKEFFFVSPAEVRTVLASKVGNLLELTEHAESVEYLQSVRYWPSRTRS